MQAYQSIHSELTAAGGSLAAVSPQLPDGSLTMAEKHALEFEVLSDAGNLVAGQFGLIFRLPDDLRAVYEHAWKLVLPQFNGDDSWTLPIPATYVIDRDGVIRYAFVDPDHTRRAEPDELLAAVRAAA